MVKLALLHSSFVTGFTDAEGCWGIYLHKKVDSKLGWVVLPRFQLTLHEKDRVLLELIQFNFGGVGNIGSSGNNSIA